ncbi:hypothetical protein SARC_10356 [Sphaeroforma arctica JP610]|uniref:Glucosyltransferase 24 catalytic domain-containing protein n=1 Tax=Sphaeroforma arctica JP610 TaxID=667725 RepID=A0A0L0FK95_9EUKA|nr:hypothetical protein SARC_10356 [Sphaeroforma arctica JP610]KNC77175.1 hypothetical protein SARC_10356 [Sphaeroforma arctica JP610]|eukprot:XP_014151077.1 hypothetical protein SARC_10356 [Sphaeroforma arctica JP610]
MRVASSWIPYPNVNRLATPVGCEVDNTDHPLNKGHNDSNPYRLFDLPNSLQPHVQIFSLPQEWLWCETWCSLETKATAKTIDLCNNPETKEPKLIAAKRIVPEWVALDIEVQALHDEVHAAPPAQVETKQEL